VKGLTALISAFSRIGLALRKWNFLLRKTQNGTENPTPFIANYSYHRHLQLNNGKTAEFSRYFLKFCKEKV